MLISFFDKYLSTLQIDSMDSTLVKAGKKEGRLPCNVEILPSTTTTNSLRDLHFNVAGVGKKVLLPDHFFLKALFQMSVLQICTSKVGN